MPANPYTPITQVNTFINGEQVTSAPISGASSQNRPMRAIAMAADGSFAVTWTSEANNETSSALLGTYVRFFDKDGVPTSAEIQVDTDNRGNQTAASIALLDNGNYIITWSDNNPDPLSPGDAWDVYARIFQPNGTAIGNEFRINGSAEHFALNNQFNSSVATSSNGNFVVTWVTQNQIDANFDPLDPGDGIYARVFNQSGAAVTAEFAVNTTIINNQLKPTVAMADNGSFVIVWESLLRVCMGSVSMPQGQNRAVNFKLTKRQIGVSGRLVWPWLGTVALSWSG
ncbi:MAG: hypothetical protein MUF49_10480 [Oculatellaceae cyanobacterium Prado106]|nr:hypothetical protein [Oculatellaceae cyanobacterium Prado106]